MGPAQPPARTAGSGTQKDISLALFDAGVNSYQARKYDEAQRSFTDFLKNYKDHSQAPEAQYYLAECYFQRNQFADAAPNTCGHQSTPRRQCARRAYLKQGNQLQQAQSGCCRQGPAETLIKIPQFARSGPRQDLLKTNK